MKKLLALVLAGMLLAVPAMAGRILLKQQVAEIDLSGGTITPYTEQYSINTKGQAYYVVIRVVITGGSGASNGFVLAAWPQWDRGESVPTTPVMQLTLSDGTATADSVKTTAGTIDNMYLVHWGDVAIDLPEGTYPPYVSLQVRHDYTAGTARIYVYMVAR
jgi:hypothetical protein